MFTAEGPQCHLTQMLVLLLCMFVRVRDFAGKELHKLAERSWFIE